MWNGIKGFGKIKNHNQIGYAFVNVNIPIKENHGKQTDRQADRQVDRQTPFIWRKLVSAVSTLA